MIVFAPAHLMSWVSRAPSGPRPISTAMDFDSLNDLDVSGDRVLVLGLGGNAKGDLAADGAIAWTAIGAKLRRRVRVGVDLQLDPSGR